MLGYGLAYPLSTENSNSSPMREYKFDGNSC